MNLEIGFLFAVLGSMVYLFLTEKLPVELTAFIGLMVLTFGGYLSPAEAFQGFSSPAVITMFSIFFVSTALLQTGVADAAGAGIHRLVGNREAPLIVMVMLVAGVLSAFMNNVAATAVLLPAVASLARQARVEPSRLFMPLAFGAILGGTTTLVGTPPNILTAEMMSERGLAAFELFDFTPFGLALLGVGVLFMVTVGRRLLPTQAPGGPGRGQALTEIYRLRERLFSIRVPEGSPLHGLTLRQAQVGTALRVHVVAILRGGDKELAPDPGTTIRAHDVLLVEGEFSDLEQLLRMQGVEVEESAEVHLREAAGRFSGVVVRLGDASGLVGRTVQDLRLRDRFGVVVAGLWRQGSVLHDRPGGLPLAEGDEILALGERARIEDFAALSDFDVVEIGPGAVQRLEEGLFQLRVSGGSPLAGLTLRQSGIGHLLGLTVVGRLRDGDLEAVDPDDRLEEGDLLLVTGEPARVLSLIQVGEVEVEERAPDIDLESEGVQVLEAVVAPRSELAGKSLRDLDFRERYGVQVLALWRGGEPIHVGLAELPLAVGDALLLQGPAAKLRLLGADPDFVVLSPAIQAPRRTHKAPFALGALAFMVALVVGGFYPIQVAAFAAAVVAVISGALTMDEAYRAIEWRAIFLVAAILPVGIAMERSGAALLMAEGVVATAGGVGPTMVLVALLVLSSMLSQGLDGAPTVVLLAPVVFHAAEQLAISPRPLMMGVGLAASAAFMTPFSHKANLLVMSAGGYRVTDFIRVGAILTVIILGLLAVMIPLLLPF